MKDPKALSQYNLTNLEPIELNTAQFPQVLVCSTIGQAQPKSVKIKSKSTSKIREE